MTSLGQVVLYRLPIQGLTQLRPAIVTSTDNPAGLGLHVYLDGMRDWPGEIRGELISAGMTLNGVTSGHIFAKQGTEPGTWRYRPGLARDARTAEVVGTPVGDVAHDAGKKALDELVRETEELNLYEAEKTAK